MYRILGETPRNQSGRRQQTHDPARYVAHDKRAPQEPAGEGHPQQERHDWTSVREAFEQVVVEEAHTLVALAHGPHLSLQAPRSDDQGADEVVQERLKGLDELRLRE